MESTSKYPMWQEPMTNVQLTWAGTSVRRLQESWGRWTALAKHLDFVGRIYMLLMHCMIFREKQLWSIGSLLQVLLA